MIHVPVLLGACLDGLNIRPDGVYVDGTLGRAGHTAAIAERLNDKGRVVAIDKDDTALSEAKTRLGALADKVTLVKGDFRDVGAILTSLGIDQVNGMLFDLGVSSPQLDDAARGFSYMADAPLDMRMDQSAAVTAAQIVNTWPEDELKRILYTYGEERYAPRIAAQILRRRAEKPIETTSQLTDIIRSAMPAKALREKQHPAKRSFQAFRIAVNDELGAIADMLDTAPDNLALGGRLCVISFHSLEDRLVKTAIARREKGCTCPRDFPICVCGFQPTLRSVVRKPVTPTAEEIQANPRARSAKLRIAERV